MTTYALTSTALVVTAAPVVRANVIWTLTSTATAICTGAGAPYKLNVLGEIGKIPYFGPLS